MNQDDEVAKPSARSLWNSATHFEFSGPSSCRVGVLCNAMGNRFFSKAQATRLRLCAERPLSFDAPGGEGCLHRLVPIGRRVAEAFGLEPVGDDEVSIFMNRLGYIEDSASGQGWGDAQPPAVRTQSGFSRFEER